MMNIFIDLSIQSETPPAVYFSSDHLQEQECDVYSHGDAWDGRVMAPGHAPSLLSSDFVTLHVWLGCWEHSHSRPGFSTAAPRLSVGCWSCAETWELLGRSGVRSVRYALEIICSFRDAPHKMTTALWSFYYQMLFKVFECLIELE